MDRRALLTALAALPLGDLAFAGAARADAPTQGRLVEHRAMASAHAAPRDVTVWLPPGYDEGTAAHPVLYMHDGQNLFDASRAPYGAEWGVDEHVARLAATGQIRAPIVVGVGNTPLRLREYLPAPLMFNLPPDLRDGVEGIYGGPSLSQGYMTFLVEELKPFIDRTYRTLPGPADTVIMGSSMGGLISMYATALWPGVFGACACLSTHWPGRIEGLDDPGDLAIWRERVVAAWTGAIRPMLPDPARARFYFDRGDESPDAFYAVFHNEVDQVFRDRGYGPDRFRSLYFPGAEHNERSWNGRLDVPLTFLLAPQP
jgi:pimeloyl-ACP methyl ester carboxylesterase